VEVAIFADVLVKHAAPLGERDIATVAVETLHRGLADAVIVSGRLTGDATPERDVATVKAAVGDAPVLVGSGLTSDGVSVLRAADGAIVGTYFHRDGRIDEPVALERVQALVTAAGVRA
jgi:predicted TIM-barrel enzyme